VTAFKDSADGRYLRVLEDDYGVRSTVSAQDDLTLPAASSLTVRTAQPKQKGTS
jgi:hypothetical protein